MKKIKPAQKKKEMIEVRETFKVIDNVRQGLKEAAEGKTEKVGDLEGFLDSL